MLAQAESIAGFLTIYFAVRELCFFVRGEPPSALDATLTPQLGDCLPSNALLGGQFTLDRADLETTGRVVFVPGRERKGLYVASGFAMCSHLAGGGSLYFRAGWQPMWFLGAVFALLARKLADCRGGSVGGKSEAGERSKPQPRLRDSMRLLCRVGELAWMLCCVWQLQRCEAEGSGWQPRCE